MRQLAILVLLGLSACNVRNAEAEEDQVEVAEGATQRLETSADTLEAKVAAPQNVALNEQIATMINLNGHLCAKVVRVSPLVIGGNRYEVTCIEYRGGSGRVRYIFDAEQGTAFKA
ncbi:hypothetical protein GRI44_13795 [Altererythrobacter confluentis]|uniref:PepSY domain-containing protein n=1 Tax=Allopontixanthobacter confluentis TaxID=1849021 RepID=A0A6L7GIJ3_9SPHN|nr:hypothetical protein [Allopontixanthobacter confluentis]MXP15822.1 hypothetical protein [Allopontixanthobacter confluentis]